MFLIISFILNVLLYNYILSVFFSVFSAMQKSEGLVSITSETMTVVEVDELVRDDDVGKFAQIMREELIRHREIVAASGLSDMWPSDMDSGEYVV